MDLIEKIKVIGERIKNLGSSIETEEATKNAFIMPFIQALGYDVFNPSEVVPEFTADHGVKKGEKVDYAIVSDDGVSMIFECKRLSSNLKKEHGSQLYRYFSTVKEVRFGVLTNGQIYQFYSDLENSNTMDKRPFFTIDVCDFDTNDIEELRKFTKAAFHLEDILSTASDLMYANAIKKMLDDELENPSDGFVKFFASRIYEGAIRQNVLEQFRKLVKKARKKFIDEKINERLTSALSHGVSVEEGDEVEVNHIKDDGIVTTDEEIEAFNIVKAVLRKNVDVKKIFMRDNKSYCAILLDDNNRKPICRLRFNSKNLSVGIVINKVEEKHTISSLEDIFELEPKLIDSLNSYLEI